MNTARETLTPIGYLLHRMEHAVGMKDNLLNTPGEKFIDLLIVGLRIYEGDRAPFDPMFMRVLAGIAVGALYDALGEEGVGFRLAAQEEENPQAVYDMAGLVATCAAMDRIQARIAKGLEPAFADEADLKARLSREVGGDIHICTPEESGYERACRVCGCTHSTPCIDAIGAACRWVGRDLCSACVGKEKR
jgi:hypothetical protein